ncbi:MAG: DUF6768 family protein [Pseudomonadota bacterium]
MNQFDAMISETLTQEEQALMDELRHEPGYFAQAIGMLQGQNSWVNWVVLVVQTAMFLIAVWMGIEFFNAEDTVTQLRWGLPAVTLAILAAVLKMSLMPVMQSNRILREMRRLELLLVQQRQD